MSNKNNEFSEQFGEARAIYFAMQYGAISYEEAKRLTSPLLRKLNIAIGHIARRYDREPELIKFQDLGRNL